MKKNVYILGMLLVLLGMACKDDDDSTWTPADRSCVLSIKCFP